MYAIGKTERHIVRANSNIEARECIEAHLTKLWGEKETESLMKTLRFIMKWDDTEGYKVTFYIL